MNTFSKIPVIDISSLLAGEARASVLSELKAAYGKTGFGYIVGHGIEADLIDAVFEASRRFHGLPLVEKMAVEVDRLHRGYIPINTSTDVTSTLAEVTKPNQSASFMVMREDAIADPEVYLSGPNQWPDLAGFRAVLDAYVAQMSALGARLMQAMLEAVDADVAEGMAGFEVPTTWLRLLHYPSGSPQDPKDLYGSAPHTDFGALTFLAQDDVGGLQVQTPNGDWIDAPRVEDSFVVNVGDMLHRMSNGRLLSTPHRVINRSGRERYSCPFFYDPHMSTVIKPLAGTGQPRFEPLLFADFLRSELEASYEAHRPKS